MSDLFSIFANLPEASLVMKDVAADLAASGIKLSFKGAPTVIMHRPQYKTLLIPCFRKKNKKNPLHIRRTTSGPWSWSLGRRSVCISKGPGKLNWEPLSVDLVVSDKHRRIC